MNFVFRLLVEADPPHHVVHANAACRRLRNVLTEASIRSDNHDSITYVTERLKGIDIALCDELARLQISIYPVLGSDEREITHFLFWIKSSGRFLLHLSRSKGEQRITQTVG
jgi:hypothetical protein